MDSIWERTFLGTVSPGWITDHDGFTLLICCDTSSEKPRHSAPSMPQDHLKAPNHNVAHTEDGNLLLSLMLQSLKTGIAPTHPTGLTLAPHSL